MTDQPTRPTLASLSKEVETLRATLKPVDRDNEASVIDRCVRAIATLPPVSDSTYSHRTTSYTRREGVERVLDYLRQRYGLPDPGAEARGLESQLRAAGERVQLLEYRLQQITSAVQS